MDPAARTTGSAPVVVEVVPTAAPAPAAPPGAAVAVAAAPPAAAAAAAWPATNWKTWRQRWAQSLFILGCAAAALAAFAISSSSPTPDSRRLLGACAPTDAEAAALLAAAKELLLVAAAQVLGATTALLLPRIWLVTLFCSWLGWVTGYCASNVMWLLVACHGEVHGVLAVYYCVFIAMLSVLTLVGVGVSVCGLSYCCK